MTGPQQIEHAGYTRYVLDKNPRRYNEYGDELEDSESDQEADADAQDENAYSGVHLEGETAFPASATCTVLITAARIARPAQAPLRACHTPHPFHPIP